MSLLHDSRVAEDLLSTAKAEIGKAVVGHDRAIEGLMVAALARGHILIEGPPGSAKTLLARAVARVVGGYFQRVQFTPETTPTEILGEVVMKHGTETFAKGPIFTNVFLADEINRGPARTQAALLEAMQERHVTMRGRTHWIDSPFLVVATQNPHEHHGVFPLAESQLDRFLIKLHVGFGSAEDELAILQLPQRGAASDIVGDIHPFLANGRLLQLQEAADAIEVPSFVARKIVDIVRFTRSVEGVELGASSRSAVHLLASAKAHALLRGRGAATTDDVLTVAPLVLPHRLIVLGSEPAQVVDDAIRHVLLDTGEL